MRFVFLAFVLAVSACTDEPLADKCGDSPNPPAYGVEFGTVNGRDIVYTGLDEYARIDQYILDSQTWIQCVKRSGAQAGQ